MRSQNIYTGPRMLPQYVVFKERKGYIDKTTCCMSRSRYTIAWDTTTINNYHCIYEMHGCIACVLPVLYNVQEHYNTQ